MRKFQSNSVKALAFSASALAFVVAGAVYAQDQDPDEQEEELLPFTQVVNNFD